MKYAFWYESRWMLMEELYLRENVGGRCVLWGGKINEEKKSREADTFKNCSEGRVWVSGVGKLKTGWLCCRVLIVDGEKK